MSSLGMSASLKARMQYGPKNKLRTNKDKISIVCFARDINATFNRKKREMNIVQIFNNILNENHCDFMSKLLSLKSQSTWSFFEYSAYISLFSQLFPPCKVQNTFSKIEK